MAGRGVSVLLFFVKWVIVPVGLAALGFFLVGPRIGTDESVAGSLPPGRTAFGVDFGEKEERPVDETGPRTVRRSGEPQVDVSVRPATNRREPRPSDERRRAPQPPPVEEPIENPGWDEGADGVPDFAPVPDPVPYTDPAPAPPDANGDPE
ncbi:MAG: hypothetical protein SNJ74_02960 [Fimbriimonadaceae bacterium]